MNLIVRTGITILAIVSIATSAVFAQQATTRVEGKVTDPVTHKPIGCTINIVSPSGKKTKISSSESDGTYLAVLNDGGAHKFQFTGFNVYRAEFTVDIPPATRFQEVKRDFEVRGLVEGELVLQVRGFDHNQPSITGSGAAELKKLKETLTSNQQMNVVVTVLPDEDMLAVFEYQVRDQYRKDSTKWAKDYAAWEKKYKKKKEKPEPPVAPVPPPTPGDPNQALLAGRKAAIESFMKDVKNSDIRVSVQLGQLPASAKYVPPVAPPPATKSKSKKSKATTAQPPVPQVQQTTHNTLVVKVGKVKRLFD